jgi:hypothetical protein
MSDDRDDLQDRLNDVADEIGEDPDIDVTISVYEVTQEDVDNGDDGELIQQNTITVPAGDK